MVVPMLAMISVNNATGVKVLLKVKCGTEETLSDGRPAAGNISGLHRPDSSRNINKVKKAEEKSDLLKCPVAAGNHDSQQKQRDREERDPFRNIEQAQGLSHADVFRDEGKPIDQRQVKNRKPTPELSETRQR